MRTGEQNARGDLSSRISASTCTLACAASVDAHARERGREGGQQASAGEHVVVLGRPHQVRQVRRRRSSASANPSLAKASLSSGALVEALGVLQEASGRRAACRSRRPGPPSTAPCSRRSQARRRARAPCASAGPSSGLRTVLVTSMRASWMRCRRVAVGLVGLHDARLTQADALAVDLDLGASTLGVGDLVGDLLGLVAHEAVDAQVEQQR